MHQPLHPKALQEALQAIADSDPVAWGELEQVLPDAAQLESLRLIEDVCRAFRQRDEETNTPAETPILFRWGMLEAREKIGEGSNGEVFRAFDPWLRREVALKLLRERSHGGLDEARSLARLRHHNVLAVYGCGVHDERAGMWSELIDGSPLAQLVQRDGAFSVEEALRIGRDLARALACVHAAGLVHGDVKAENVLRERGGRTVLMDFGAGGEARLQSTRSLISGTLRYLPPEVLDGAPLSASSDLYALGVLIFFLLTARMPYEAADATSLRSAQCRGDVPRLSTLREDLTPELAAALESCIAPHVENRPRDAAAMAALLTPQPLRPISAPPRRRFFIAAAVAAVGIAAVGTVLWQKYATPATWNPQAHVLRVGDRGAEILGVGANVKTGDRLRLRFVSDRAAFLYVLDEDAEGRATVLHPLPTSGNPVSPGASLELPGGAGSTLAWEVTAGSAREEIVVLAATHALPDLEAAIATWQRAAERTRAIGAVVEAPVEAVQGTQLRGLLAQLDAQHDPNLRVWHFDFGAGR